MKVGLCAYLEGGGVGAENNVDGQLGWKRGLDLLIHEL